MLRTGAAAAITMAAARGSRASALPDADAAAGAVKLDQLRYDQVKLAPGPLRQQFDQTQARFLGLSNDMLLKPYRLAAGMDAPGEDMGGWYSNSPFWAQHGGADGFVPGHSFGQYMSALARGYAITGSRETQTKVRELVAGLRPTLVSRFYDRDQHLPAYVFDKLNCGLVDAANLAGVDMAAPALELSLDAALPHLPEKALSRFEQRARPHQIEGDTWDESYTLPENLFLAFRRTGNPRFRDAAVRFLEDDLYFNPLAEDINVLPGEHAYSHVNALSSAMQAYLVLGSRKHLRAATNGFRMVQAQSFATGGWGPGETLLRPGTDDLARSIFREAASFETPCGAYAHLKLTRYLLRVTGDSQYGDSMERVLYNTVLGAKPILEDGSSFYYSDYTLSGRKTYHHDKWPCCSGTLPQVAADYGISSYFATPTAMYVNLYVPSEVTWQQAGARCTLLQQTEYPARNTTRLTLRAAATRSFDLNLRIPAWAGSGTRLLVNGKAVSQAVQPGTFHAISREWRNGDTVELELEMKPRLETIAMKDPDRTSYFAALLRGPQVYMATGHWPVQVDSQALLAATTVAGGDALSVATTAGAVIHRPFAAIGDELYRTYQPLLPA